MPHAGVSLLLLAVLIVDIQAQWIPANGVTFLSGLQSGIQLQTGHPWRNLGLLTSSSGTNGLTPSTGTNGFTRTGFLQQLQSVPLQSITSSSTSLVDPQLLGPNEGIGHNSPQQVQNILTTGTGISSGTLSGGSTNNVEASPYSLPGRISPVRGPNGEVFRITSDVLLPLIAPDQFNRLPTLGGNGDAVTSTGEYINTLAPRPGGQTGSGFQFGPSFGPGFPGPFPFLF